ncbi:MAG: LacI family DNA-binding transcriptional regulator, partial [Deltaproteobacteria bacterium]|nr:LacI family DNA-binding transcriptional regulator [Deltaproteobacteria bacterium]
MKKVSIQDVAAAAGVSTATVDRVLNNRQGVHPKTTEKVKLAILKLNYQTKALITKFHQAKICRI